MEVQIEAGPELIWNEFLADLINRGIKLRLTAPYTSEMNGIAECLIHTITKHACAMLQTANLPIGFQAATISMPTFLKNCSPTKILYITPYEAWWGTKPILGWIKTFRCCVKVAILDEIYSKMVRKHQYARYTRTIVDLRK